MSEDVSPHDWLDDFIILSSDRNLVLVACMIILLNRRLCSYADGSEGIHNHVYPEKLNNAKWTISKSRSCNKDNRDAYNVNAELELKELPNIVYNISSPKSGIIYSIEIILSNNNLRCILSDLTSTSHAEANVCLLESINIVQAVPSY